MPARKDFTEKHRQEAVGLVCEGMAAKAVAKKFGVTPRYIRELYRQAGWRPDTMPVRETSITVRLTPVERAVLEGIVA